MKKLTLTLLLIVSISFTSIFAQEESDALTNKNGKVILPQAGDWAIGIDATPFLTYFGGFLSNAGATAPTFNTPNGFTVYGKKFITSKTAYRGSVRFNMASTSNNNFISLPSDPTSEADQKEAFKTSTVDIMLNLGMEKRIGDNRIQGIYGASGVIGYNNNGVTSRKNEVSTSNTYQGPFILKDKPGATFTLAAQAFVGVEYFVAPKISIAGEVSYLAGISMTGKGKTKVERWDNGTSSVSNTETTGTSSSSSAFLNGNPTGNLRLMFHF